MKHSASSPLVVTGTIEAVANEVGSRVPIGILPLGTENLLSRYLGIKTEPERLVKMLNDGHTIDVDAGRANGRLFLVMLSCGFDAEVVRRVHRERQGNITHLAWGPPDGRIDLLIRLPEYSGVVRASLGMADD